MAWRQTDQQPQLGFNGANPSPTYYNTFINPQVPIPQPAQGQNGPQQNPLDFVRDYAAKNNLRGGDETGGTSRKITDAMKAAGYDVDYEGADIYGRSSGLFLNGVPTKLWDGSGNFIVKPYTEAEGDTTGYDFHTGRYLPGYGPPGGNQQQQMYGAGPSMGMGQEQDPMAWRRQHYMKQYQKPNYNSGGVGQPSPVQGGNAGMGSIGPTNGGSFGT